MTRQSTRVARQNQWNTGEFVSASVDVTRGRSLGHHRSEISVVNWDSYTRVPNDARLSQDPFVRGCRLKPPGKYGYAGGGRTEHQQIGAG